MADAAVEIVPNTPAGETGNPYIVREATAPIPEAQQEAFDKALGIWEAADAEAGELTEAVQEPEAAADPAKPVGETTPAVPADADKLFEQKFSEYRRQYSKLDAERQELKTELAEYHKLKADLAEARYNPNKLLEIGGVPQEEFTKLLLSSGGEMSPEMRVALEAKQRAEASEKQLSTLQRSMQERQEQSLMDDYRNEAAAFVANAGDEHEFTRNLGAEPATQLIMQEINGHYAANLDPSTGQGPVLSYKEAADRIEKRIEADMFERYAKTKKMQAKMQEMLGPQRVARPGRTITGNMAGQTASGKHLTDDERMQSALKQLAAGWQ